MLDAQMLGDELVLGTNIVIDGYVRKWLGRVVRWGRRLAISEQGWDDDKVVLGIQGFVRANEPEIVGYG